MTSYLIDVNVWLALTWDQHPQHGPAGRWFQSVETASFLFCRTSMLGLLRLLTNQQVMGGSTVTLAEALALYDRWLADPRVELLPEPRLTDRFFRKALAHISRLPATKAVADCYLAAFAEAANAQLVTFDAGLANTARSRRVPYVHLKPVRAGR